YDAISYTWGNQQPDQDLGCEDSIKHITANLSSALRRFRSKYRTRNIWADAIYINQDDVKEKSQQLLLMGCIYRSAKRVRVWLGKGSEDETRAVDGLTWLAKTSGPRKI
ncbi:hypothetical protein K469DRAFT_579057, partial [Zopfia rhizophila CBS 207.26]